MQQQQYKALQLTRVSQVNYDYGTLSHLPSDEASGRYFASLYFWMHHIKELVEATKGRTFGTKEDPQKEILHEAVLYVPVNGS